MKTKNKTIACLVIATLALSAVMVPFALAATDTTTTSATVSGLTAISVTQSISITQNPGSSSGILELTIDNIGSNAITAVEVKQYVANLSATSYNGTAFVHIAADTGLTEDTMSYGDLYVATSASVPGEITTNIATPSASAKYGVLTLVYSTTSVDATNIERAVQFGFCWNGTNTVIINLMRHT